MGRRGWSATTEAAIAATGVLIVAELAWDRVHDGFGTHRVLKLVVLLCAVVGVVALEVSRRTRAR
jgi:hypothetical protein